MTNKNVSEMVIIKCKNATEIANRVGISNDVMHVLIKHLFKTYGNKTYRNRRTNRFCHVQTKCNTIIQTQ